ncbi:selenocysteine-specific translation elongation factor [Bacillus alkalicellulosilyticus]|uniref:selenocysteine-specific translation elongation factor n=1 Tax=Alkalihalobacterium alkalicellulosilyticum TaxID=1912214 RepID=UPI000996B5DC|nr:selenocysteine-specific translation elongation factor [Bacillus alkalicellulosilyticus]
MSVHYTVGMAGHIDHGKTSLTKALTNVDTDRLKEEKERNISIEPGYAPFQITDEMTVSIIDVPGHERFIRQMIAGVAGIDIVMLVIAADEGVMPQTREHVEILSLLQIQRGMIVITKVDRVDEELLELVQEDIEEQLRGTFLEDSPTVVVDSLSGKGIEDVRLQLIELLPKTPHRNANGAFRLPIDQVFTVHGQGTVVRGTVYEGMVREGETLLLLPQQEQVRARQIQIHQQPTSVGRAGQRVAINIGGISKEQCQRGDVLVSSDSYVTTQTVDVALQVVKSLQHEVKQRAHIKFHIGTAEVYGKIVFFDRNQIEGNEQVLCQVRLDEPVVAKRGDRFIVRRPTPVETIGGGEIIEPRGERYRFGQATIDLLEKKLAGTPEDRISDVLMDKGLLNVKEISQFSGMEESETLATISMMTDSNQVIEWGGYYTLTLVYEQLLTGIVEELHSFHEKFSMQQGKKKAEIIQTQSLQYPEKLIERVLEQAILENQLKKDGPFIAQHAFFPHVPKSWEKRVENVLEQLKKQYIEVKPIAELLQKAQIPEPLHQDIIHFLSRENVIYPLDDALYITHSSYERALLALQSKYDTSFSLQEAKVVLPLSRKYLVPFLELLDKKGMTERVEAERKWK